MSAFVQPGTEINLDNCAAEPIHIPGSIQPHGALLAFLLDGTLATRSANAQAMLGAIPAPGESLGQVHLTESIRTRIATALIALHSGETVEVGLPDGRAADLTLHVHDKLVFAEFEPRGPVPAPTDFASITQRALDRIQRQSDIDGLLEASCEEIAALSGFDRVMAYRFHPDDSGEVVAERRAKPLESYLGMRYPASDIPAQARVLFIKNPVRLIMDVAYRPVPLQPDRHPLTGLPIDLSHAVLRSVSPIHCEYLTNMGVRASMSVSIVVQGRLWGLFACHHYAPHLVSPAVRITCRLLSQMVSLMVERLLAIRHADALARARELRSALMDRAHREERTSLALTVGAPSVRDIVRCSGVAAASVAQVETLGDVPSREAIDHLLAWLAGRGAPATFATSELGADAPQSPAALDGFAGVLAIRYSTELNSYVLWFRRQEIQTLRWAGDPAKPITLGPHGTRLSPRGSFSEWKEIVRGRAERWEDIDLQAVEDLRRDLAELLAARLQETVRARDALLAMLGHDLRNPLHAIQMASEVLHLDQSRVGLVQKQIARVSGRMGRLINHVLDLSRLNAGIGLVTDRRMHELGSLLRDIVADARSAHPESTVVEDFAGIGTAEVDSDRLSQVLVNLLSNARHHGDRGRPVLLEGRRNAGEITISVTNEGPPITQQALQKLFEPFKRGSLDNPTNPRGLGMGLYIASSIVEQHGGSLEVESAGGRVTFRVRLPSIAG